MKHLLTILTFIALTQSTLAYQNPYQQMWFDGWWRKDCNFNTTLQMCESESENFRDGKAYNNYHNGVNGYYCKNGYLYQAMGYNQQLILQTTEYGRPTACTLDTHYSYEQVDKIQQLNKIKRRQTW